MRVVKCIENHFFDADKYSACPQCGAPMGIETTNNANPIKSAPTSKSSKGETFGIFKKRNASAPVKRNNPAPVKPVVDNYQKLSDIQVKKPAMNANSLLGDFVKKSSSDPVPAPEPVVERRSVLEPIATVEPKPVAIPEPAIQPEYVPIPEIATEPEPIPTPEPAVEREFVLTPEIATEPEPIPTPEPAVEREFVPTPEVAAEPEPIPMPEPAVQLEYIPIPEVAAESEPDITTEDEVLTREDDKVDNNEDSLLEEIKKVSSDNDGRTVGFFSSSKSSSSEKNEDTDNILSEEPVVGWLICIKGPNLGQSFNIYTGRNSLGRSNTNKIVINLDKSISRDKHSWIIYEPKNRTFYVQPGESSGLTYVNDQMLLQAVKIEKRSVIEVGNTKLMLIPLCNEEFSWEEYI